MPNNERFRILIADENRGRRRKLAEPLANLGYLVETAPTAFTAVDMIAGANPRYDWFIMNSDLDYQSGWHKREGWDGVLMTLSRTDIDLPVMMTGPDSAKLAVEVTSHGDRIPSYITVDGTAFVQEVVESIQRNLILSADVGPVKLIKFGGSSLDFDFDNRNSDNLQRAVEFCCNYIGPEKHLIQTVGAGMFGDIQKEWLEHHNVNEWVYENFRSRMRDCLEHNVRNVRDLSLGKAKYVPFRLFGRVTSDFLDEHVAIMPIAPFPIYRKHGINANDSDVQTIATAAFYGAEDLILLKCTDGVYKFDPLLGYKEGIKTWKRKQRSNERITEVKAMDLLGEGISRKGAFDGKGDHLLENNAIIYWLERAPNLKNIYVIHIAPEMMFVPYGRGGKETRHIVDPTIQFKPLEEQLADAFNGHGYKITRE